LSLSAGSRLGPYEILSPIGAGGMGEVYKAKDTRLDRTVAVKVLPTHLSSSPEVRQRFEREAKTISQLSHAHICALYDVGREGEVDYLVMEYLEGETLSARLVKGPVPTDQLLRWGVEIADALDKAHRQGIVHRDLKPGNVMLTTSGVKLLDFGLAKVMAASGRPLDAAGREQAAAAQHPTAGFSLTALPTVMGSPNLTQEGTILGTFQYMAPEQLEGREADSRSDIFAFGAVLYEMATGKKAFEGKSQASLIASILTADPAPVSTVQPMTPLALDRVVKTCLAKDPEDRWQSAHDIGSELQWIAQGGSQAGGVAAPVAASRRRRDRVSWGVAGAAGGAVLAALLTWALVRSARAAAPAVTHAAIALPASESLVLDGYMSLAISPDGSRVVYLARIGDARQLFVRSLGQVEATPLNGTVGARSPFFSSDGQWVGFWADGRLQKVALAGGTPVTIASVPEPLFGGAWGADDTIVHPKNFTGGLVRVPASGGPSQPVTKPDLKGEDRGHIWPDILPGGKAVLFTVFTGGSLDDYAIAVRSLATGEQKTLVRGGTCGRYVASGHIVYGRGNVLFAVPFDVEKLAVTGAPYPVAQGVMLNTNGGAEFAVSRTGTLVFVPGGLLEPDRALMWVDRKGAATPMSKTRKPFSVPAISPDGKRVAVLVEAATYDIWVLDVERDSLTRFSFGKDDNNPVWSPDGRQIAYNSSQAGPTDIFSRASDGSGAEMRLTNGPDASHPQSWSRDGKVLAFQKTAGALVPEIWLYPFGPKPEPRPFLQGPYRHEDGRFSPDSRWMAYVSNESGRSEVYVTAFPGPGGKWQVSTEGGEQPRWAPGGSEIFFRKGRKVLRVGVSTAPAFSVSKPELLFEAEYESGWDVAPDGKRFVMLKDEGVASAPKHFDLVLGWFEELKARAPQKTK
jgi:Tol biopolymer transport system component